MSRALTILASAALVFRVPAAVRAADDEPKDIIAKAIKAQGGEDLLTKNKAGTMKLKGKLTLPGAGDVEIVQEVSFMIPDKLRESSELTIMGNTINTLMLVNGDKITIEVNGKEINTPDQVKDALKDAAHVLDIARLTPLKDKKYELSLIGEDKVEGKKVVGVRVSAKDKKDVSMYFYKDTWLLAKLEYRGVDQATGKEINDERLITEYGKSKSGKPVPKKIIVKHDGKQFLEAEVLEVQTLEKLDDDVFKK